MAEDSAIGRNEPCPCKSGKKYKRCCGAGAAPKLTTPRQPAAGGPAFDPSALEGFDPQQMMQMSQALQRLPRGQMQRLQAMMQKAMSGKDVTAEAAEFERSLPEDVKQMLQSFSAAGMGAGLGGDETMAGGGMPAGLPDPFAMGLPSPEPEPSASMTLDQARAVIQKAVSDGSLSPEEANKLLESQSGSSEEIPSQQESSIDNGKKTGFWSKFKKS